MLLATTCKRAALGSLTFDCLATVLSFIGDMTTSTNRIRFYVTDNETVTAMEYCYVHLSEPPTMKELRSLGLVDACDWKPVGPANLYRLSRGDCSMPVSVPGLSKLATHKYCFTGLHQSTDLYKYLILRHSCRIYDSIVIRKSSVKDVILIMKVNSVKGRQGSQDMIRIAMLDNVDYKEVFSYIWDTNNMIRGAQVMKITKDGLLYENKIRRTQDIKITFASYPNKVLTTGMVVWNPRWSPPKVRALFKQSSVQLTLNRYFKQRVQAAPDLR